MSWPFEISEPFITPRRGTEFQRQRHGLTPEEWALPPTLVARFQKDAYRRMLERAGVDANNPADRTTGEVDGVAEIGAVRRCPRGGWGAGGYRQPP
jgi:hypothetical protein